MKGVPVRSAVAAFGAAVLLAGCGSAFAGSPRHAGPAEPGAQTLSRARAGGGPRPGSRAEALAYGRHLLTLPVLPPGTRAARKGQRVPAEISSPAPPFAKDLVSLARPLVTPGTPAQVQAYLLAHAPKGAEKSWGQLGAPGAPSAWDVGFFLPTPREGIYLGQLEVTIAPTASRSSVVNETAFVIWFPPRSPAENLLNPAGYRSVTITADVVYPRTRQVTRTFSGITATRLLMFLGGQQAAPDDAPVSCPMRGADFTLAFRPANPRTPAVKVTTYGCWADDIWFNGVRQPALWDMGTLYSMAAHLLGLPS